VQPAVTETAQTQADAASSSSANRNRILFLLIAMLSVAGVVVSAISLQRHYAKSATSFCDFAEKFNCDIVNRSEYSTLVGIPVAGIGVVGYGALLVLSTFLRSRRDTMNQLLGAAIAGLAFALYLTYIEGHVLDTWCVLCLISLSLISAISLLAVAAKVRDVRA
jgi:vitamin-K-epoxide reductase (warfarin-sensitive)